VNGKLAFSVCSLAFFTVALLGVLTTGCFRLPDNTPEGGGDGKAAVGGGLAANAGGGFPSGAVVAFAGPVPPGWTICDGRTSPSGRATPDLRNRFVYGADPQAADLGSAGGNATHTHEATALPSKAARGTETDEDVWMAASNHSHQVDVKPAEALPPYVKLVYAMKD
jgi:hypothetical protein